LAGGQLLVGKRVEDVERQHAEPNVLEERSHVLLDSLDVLWPVTLLHATITIATLMVSVICGHNRRRLGRSAYVSL
jgi:hypothetical protein